MSSFFVSDSDTTIINMDNVVTITTENSDQIQTILETRFDDLTEDSTIPAFTIETTTSKSYKVTKPNKSYGFVYNTLRYSLIHQ